MSSGTLIVPVLSFQGGGSPGGEGAAEMLQKVRHAFAGGVDYQASEDGKVQ